MARPAALDGRGASASPEGAIGATQVELARPGPTPCPAGTGAAGTGPECNAWFGRSLLGADSTVAISRCTTTMTSATNRPPISRPGISRRPEIEGRGGTVEGRLRRRRVGAFGSYSGATRTDSHSDTTMASNPGGVLGGKYAALNNGLLGRSPCSSASSPGGGRMGRPTARTMGEGVSSCGAGSLESSPSLRLASNSRRTCWASLGSSSRQIDGSASAGVPRCSVLSFGSPRSPVTICAFSKGSQISRSFPSRPAHVKCRPTIRHGGPTDYPVAQVVGRMHTLQVTDPHRSSVARPRPPGPPGRIRRPGAADCARPGDRRGPRRVPHLRPGCECAAAARLCSGARWA